jgi:hypothetical protein
MQIIIPTKRRVDQQLTLQSLPRELLKWTTLVCPKDEAVSLCRLYKDVDIVVEPEGYMTIARIRAWIMRTWLEAGYKKILMLDDDLTFSTRTSEGDWHLREIQGDELIPEFERLDNKLGPDFPHVGFGPRQWNKAKKAGWKTPDRMIYSLGYYLPIVVNECELGRIETREDYDVTLQLLRKGYPNAVWHRTVTDQREAYAPGGCSCYRTIESSNADVYKLARLHPGYVHVPEEEKTYKTSPERLEPICLWPKALEDGRSQK